MLGRTIGMFLVSLSALVIAAESQVPAAEPLGGTYAGEAVVRSLGGSSLVVAVDETGEGAATRLFFVETAGPVGTISLGSAVSRIEKTTDTLVVTLPREHRVFAFSLTTLPSQGTSTGPRLAVTGFENVRSIREYRGNLRQVLPLSAIGAKGYRRSTRGSTASSEIRRAAATPAVHGPAA
jgi:hypothetical protein